MKLVDQLLDGPLDIVGDVHGEIDALNKLLERLGYDKDGNHPDNRHLVFVGDLTDRGPNSPAVLSKVMQLAECERAQCVLGNHELALLDEDQKHANGWWFGEAGSKEYPQVPVDPAEKPKIRKFLASLPLVLERDDRPIGRCCPVKRVAAYFRCCFRQPVHLRVVHACWNNAAIEQLRLLDDGSTTVVDLYRKFNREFEKRWSSGALRDSLAAEMKGFEPFIKEKSWPPRYFGTKARYEREKQMNNPVAVVTSGEETETDEPFFVGGKWRMVERVKWWANYNDKVKVVIGHYWRNISDVRPEASGEHGTDLFAGVPAHHWFGAKQNVYCVDFSIGGLAEQRAAGKPLEHCSLAAVRVPEWRVEHNDRAGREIARF